MKRMSYLAGLAPAALALAAVPAAHAATTPGTLAANGKTVSLHHVLPTTARANAAAASSSSSAAGSPATTNNGCKGNTYFKLPAVGDLKGHGWYANSTFDFHTCIGTVIVDAKFHKTFCKDVGLNIGSDDAPNPWRSHHRVCGSAGQTIPTQFNVHSSFEHNPGQSIFVCANSTYATNSTCSEVGG